MKGVPYNVSVFATNGKGKGSIVSDVLYAEENCEHTHTNELYIKDFYIIDTTVDNGTK